MNPKKTQPILPYGRHCIDDSDICAVTEVLTSDWLTCGPKVEEFENAVARIAGTDYAVAVSSGTAALHTSMFAIDITPGDEVIVPATTFVATANAVIYQGGTPIFADVDPETLLVSADSVAACVTNRTKAIVGVDYAGQPCDYDALSRIAESRGIAILADASHSLGARLGARPVGSLAELTTFSFHPVKMITTGEGGVITTNRKEYADRARCFRAHGITTNFHERERHNTFEYEMVSLGFNYRISDVHCALGISQIKKLPAWLSRRQAIAKFYDQQMTELEGIRPLARTRGAEHAFHLYVVQVDPEVLGCDRDSLFAGLRHEGIGVNVHYRPVYLHPYYQDKFGIEPGNCPNAERAYQRILSLPIHPAMTPDDPHRVMSALKKVIANA